MPRLLKLQTAWDRTKQTLENVKVAFSLARFERDHKRFPKELADLVPGYLQQVPQDYFSGKPLIYRPTNSGYLLYSVGVNGKDDGGRTYEDTPPGDDLVARMPVPERKAN